MAQGFAHVDKEGKAFAFIGDSTFFASGITGVVNAGFSGLLWSPEVRQCASRSDLVRRIQLVAFSAQSLINAWNYDHQPWLDFDAADEVREMFETRMRLIPYLRKMFERYRDTGIPPVRSLICDYPEAEHIEDEYLFGDMVVAPLFPGQDTREVWLPEGEWIDYFTGGRFTGGLHTVATEGIPVYYRRGEKPEEGRISQFAE